MSVILLSFIIFPAVLSFAGGNLDNPNEENHPEHHRRRNPGISVTFRKNNLRSLRHRIVPARPHRKRSQKQSDSRPIQSSHISNF